MMLFHKWVDFVLSLSDEREDLFNFKQFFISLMSLIILEVPNFGILIYGLMDAPIAQIIEHQIPYFEMTIQWWRNKMILLVQGVKTETQNAQVVSLSLHFQN